MGLSSSRRRVTGEEGGVGTVEKRGEFGGVMTVESRGVGARNGCSRGSGSSWGGGRESRSAWILRARYVGEVGLSASRSSGRTLLVVGRDDEQEGATPNSVVGCRIAMAGGLPEERLTDADVLA